MNNDSESSGSVQIYKTDIPSFLDDGKTLNLKKLGRELGKHQVAAVEALVSLLTTKDIEPKLKLQAASALLDFQIKVQDKISSDFITRLIAEAKLNPTGRKQLTNDDDESRPMVDFQTVQHIG